MRTAFYSGAPPSSTVFESRQAQGRMQTMDGEHLLLSKLKGSFFLLLLAYFFRGRSPYYARCYRRLAVTPGAITIAIAIATDSIPALAKSKVLVSVCSHTDPCTASCNLIPFPRPFSNSLTRFLFCLGSARFCFSFPCFGLSI